MIRTISALDWWASYSMVRTSCCRAMKVSTDPCRRSKFLCMKSAMYSGSSTLLAWKRGTVMEEKWGGFFGDVPAGGGADDS